MIINFNALFKALGVSKDSYFAKQIRYALKGATVLSNEDLDKVISTIRQETALVIEQLEQLKLKEAC